MCLKFLVQEKMRRTVFKSIHNISHPGNRASRRLISRSFVWEGFSKDVNLWSQSCLNCQWSKVQTHNRRMYQGFTPILDNNLCSYICDHLRLWSTVHKLYLDRSLQVPWSHTLQPHLSIHSPMAWWRGSIIVSKCL